MSSTGIVRRLLHTESSAWLSSAADFAKSLLLLALALFAALFSNTAARSGQASSAVLGAVLALAVALWVAYRFVPRMAATVEWRWLPSVTEIQITREGWVALGLTTITGLTAINTSNNLLYMIFSALIATLLLSLVLASINLRSLTIDAVLPRECFARRSFPMKATIRNSRALLPALSIRISPDSASRFRFSSAYFPIVGTRMTETLSVETECSRRGRHRIGEIRVESRYPFGFFVKSTRARVTAECVVFPEIREGMTPDQRALDSLASRERFQRGQGTDLYLIRDYQTTDSARSVDWKASAKTASLKTREFAAEETRRVVIVLDRYGQAGDEERFEELVSTAASSLVLLADAGVEVGLMSDDWISGLGAGDVLRRSVLHYLALVEMSPSAQRVANREGAAALVLSLR